MRRRARIVSLVTIGFFLLSIASYAAWSTLSPLTRPVAGNSGQDVDPGIRAELLKFVAGFLEERIARDLDAAQGYVSEELLSRLEGGDLIGPGEPAYASADIMFLSKNPSGEYEVVARIWMSSKAQGTVGYFDESLLVARRPDGYKVVSLERSPFVQAK